MAVPVRLERGKSIYAIEGVADTWNWFIDVLQGFVGGKDIDVTRSGTRTTIDFTGESGGGGGGDDDDFPPLPEIPDVPPVDLSGLIGGGKEYIPGDDTNIVFTEVTDPTDSNFGKIKVDVYYK